MKEKIYLRIAKTKSGYLYKVDKKKNNKAIEASNYYSTAHPTIILSLNLDIADKLFEEALAELDLKVEEAENATEIKITTEEK